jgi:alpha-1,6-mannosyltransferase
MFKASQLSSALGRVIASQSATALGGAIALEALFSLMARLGDLKVEVIETIALALAAGIIYFIALWRLEHSAKSRTAFWIILAAALLFRLTLYSLTPSLSTDIQRYRWDGRVQNAGWNPYSFAPNDPRLSYLRDSGWAIMPGPEIPSMYPPLSQLVFRMTARFLPGVVAFKLPFLLGDLLVLAILAKWLQSYTDGNYRLAIYAWNPLVIVEFAASGHNDSLAIAALIAALAIIRKRPAASAITLTAGSLAKLFPITLLPLALRLSGWPRKLRGWLALGGAAIVTAASIWPYRSALAEFPQIFVRYQAIWQNYNPSLYGVLLWFAGRPDIAAGIGEGVVLGLAIWAAARKIDPMRAAFLIIGAILMLAPNTYSWYFTWIIPLLCFFPNPAWLLLTILQFLSYKVLIEYQINGIWHFDPYFQWLTYAPFYAMLIGSALIHGSGPQPEATLAKLNAEQATSETLSAESDTPLA